MPFTAHKNLGRFPAIAVFRVAIASAQTASPSPRDVLKQVQDFEDAGYKTAHDNEDFLKVHAKAMQMVKDAVKNVEPSKVDPKDALDWAQLYSLLDEQKPVFELSREFLSTHPDPKQRFEDQMLIMTSSNSLGEIDSLERTIIDVKPVDWDDLAMLGTYGAFFVGSIAGKRGAKEGLKYLDSIEGKMKYPDPKTEAQEMLKAGKGYIETGTASSPVTDDQKKKQFEQTVIGQEQYTEFSFATTRAQLLKREGKRQDALNVLGKFASIDHLRPELKEHADLAAFQIKMSGLPETALTVNKTIGSFSGLESLKGKVVILDFFAHWCHPCMESVPSMAKMYVSLHPKGLEIVGVTQFYGYFGDTQGLSEDAEFARLQDLVQEKQMTWPIVVGPKSNRAVYGAYGIPETVLIDKKGIVRDIKVGFNPSEEDQLENEVKALLKE